MKANRKKSPHHCLGNEMKNIFEVNPKCSHRTFVLLTQLLTPYSVSVLTCNRGILQTPFGDPYDMSNTQLHMSSLVTHDRLQQLYNVSFDVQHPNKLDGARYD